METREELEEIDLLDTDLILKLEKEAEELIEKLETENSQILENLKLISENFQGKVKRYSEPENEYSIVAVDSSYDPLPLDLFIGTLCAIVYGYVHYPSGRYKLSTTILPVRQLSEKEESSRLVSLHADLLELKTMRKCLKHDKLHFNTLVRDGDFPPTEIFFKPYHEAKEAFRNRLIEVTKNIFSIAQELDIGVVGIVKRIRTSLIAFKAGMGGELIGKLGDLLVASAVLGEGEYLILGRYGDLIDNEPLFPTYLKRRTGSKNIISTWKELVDTVPQIEDVVIAYYKPSTRIANPIKLLCWNIDIDDFIKFCIAHTPQYPPYPDFLNLIDKICLEYSKSLKISDLMWYALANVLERKGMRYIDTHKGSIDLLRPSSIQKLESIAMKLASIMKALR